MNMMSEDAKAILMLCGHLGGESELEPLNQREYNQVVRWLLGKNLRPSDLLSPEHIPALALESAIPEQRLNALLKRGVKLGFAVEKWNQSGVWVICRSDPDYPSRYKTHLRDKAPPILFGTGERSLLKGGGLAIVGSRDVDAEGDRFARNVATWCARGGMPVVSGGARGVDQIAMSGALEAGGIVIGVLADTLLRRSVSQEVRYALSDRRLLLISPYHPEAGFNVGNAMGRNKSIYALADYGLVVSADHKKGGTWAGAEEELRRKPGRPVFVRLADSVPAGNRKLVELGAIEFPHYSDTSDPATVLHQVTVNRSLSEKAVEPALFVLEAGGGHGVSIAREAMSSDIQIPNAQSVAKTDAGAVSSVTSGSLSVYEAVKPLIVRALEKPRTLADLTKTLNVKIAQLKDWVKLLMDEGLIEEKTKGKSKKLVVRKNDSELNLE